MTLQQLQEVWGPQIETSLETFIGALDFGNSEGLRSMLRYHMGWIEDESNPLIRGKRIRPLITLLSTGAFGQDINKAMPGAVAVELLHNFTLIHDDIEDQSPLRHGQPTLWKKWGIAQAINAGDALFSVAQLSMQALENSSSQFVVLEALREFNNVCLKLTQGQYLDISFESTSKVTTETYLDMITGKTAALIAFAAGLGALIAGQPAPIHAQLSEFGECLGLAFQIQDDYLGIWGDPAVTGKSAASDLLSHKKTLPVLYGLSASTKFQEIWHQETITDSMMDQMANLLEDCGAKEFVNSESSRYNELAYKLLGIVFPKPNDFSEALYELAEILTNRQA
jgi:geranylgeranyl diphosphate synthase, type I